MQRFDNSAVDLLPEILCRLPVKSLMRFRCVDKTWRRIIEDSNFIIKHFLFSKNASYSSNQNTSSVQNTPYHLMVKCTRRAKAFVSLLSLKQYQVSLDLLDLPYKNFMFVHLQLLGPCNGIYFLYSFPSSLINPATRELKVLPDAISTDSILTYPGFGFDHRANDYKVILLKFCPGFNAECPWLAEVYSLNSNSWRNVYSPVGSSVAVQDSLMNTFVNGAYHWLSYDADEFSVIAFDMVTEIFRTIRFPSLHDSTWKIAQHVALACVNDSLTVIVSPPPDEIIKHFDIWVLTDYSDERSWTKKLRLQPQIEVERPIGFLRSQNQFIFEDKRGKVVLFDVNTNDIKVIGIQAETKSLQVLEYEESLVSLRRKYQQDHHVDVSVFSVGADPHFVNSSG